MGFEFQGHAGQYSISEQTELSVQPHDPDQVMSLWGSVVGQFAVCQAAGVVVRTIV
jgi:hypothetical protein